MAAVSKDLGFDIKGKEKPYDEYQSSAFEHQDAEGQIVESLRHEQECRKADNKR